MPFYTREQAEALHRLREAAGGSDFDAAWRTLVSEIRAEMDQDGNPRSAVAQALARRWQELVNRFAQGNPDIERLLYETAGRWMSEQRRRNNSTPDVLSFIREAIHENRKR